MHNKVGKFAIDPDYEVFEAIVDAFPPDVFKHNFADAIFQWQYVEQFLLEIYLTILRPQNISGAAASFHAVQQFRTKLNVVEAVASFALNDADLNKWAKIRIKAEKLSKKRNNLAHFEICYIGPTPYLVPNLTNTKPSKESEDGYDTKQIIEIRRAFSRFSRRLNDFCDSLPISRIPSPHRLPSRATRLRQTQNRTQGVQTPKDSQAQP